MTVYLASDPILREAGRLQSANGFRELFLSDLKCPCSVLYIAADPVAYKANDEYGTLFFSALEHEEVQLSERTVLDGRNKADAERLVASADLIVLGDGDVCTQHAFFEEIDLQMYLFDFDGVLLGIGSGAMNASTDVFVQSGEVGTATDLYYEAHLFGLSLSRVSMVPHYRFDTKKPEETDEYLLERISYCCEGGVKKLFALPDGSFFLCCGEISVLFGEGYLIEDDHAWRCCRENECYRPE